MPLAKDPMFLDKLFFDHIYVKIFGEYIMDVILRKSVWTIFHWLINTETFQKQNSFLFQYSFNLIIILWSIFLKHMKTTSIKYIIKIILFEIRIKNIIYYKFYIMILSFIHNLISFNDSSRNI